MTVFPVIDRTARLRPSRRDFLTAGAAAGGGLLLSMSLPEASQAQTEPPSNANPKASSPDPNTFIRIGGDGRVTMIMPMVEMGQGVYTALPMLLAEELEVDFASIVLEHAPPSDKLYGNPSYFLQVTGGSSTVYSFWNPLLRAGAAARQMLIAAAAAKWGVDPGQCRAEKGVVIHEASARRVGYGELASAAAATPIPEHIVLKDPKTYKLIGAPIKRLDSPPKVRGAAQYGIDVRLPGMKIAAVAASPVRGGKLMSLDDTSARKTPGVRDVIKLDDVVAVIADHNGAARKGLAALAIKWDDGPNGGFSSEKHVRALKAAAQRPATKVARNDGDVRAADARAAVRLEAEYESPLLAHATMEPMNCTVHVRQDACDVWLGTQAPVWVQKDVAEAIGLPIEKVAVHNQYLGGGFGRRGWTDHAVQAARIAKQVDYPIKVIWSREEDIQHDFYRPYYYDKLSAGLDSSGRPVSWSHRVVGGSVLERMMPMFVVDGFDFDMVEGAAGPYDFANALVDYVNYQDPGLPIGTWRGVGVTHNAFVVESFIDELAFSAGRDPIEYRAALLTKNPRALGVLNLVAEKAGWKEPLPPRSGRGVSLLSGFKSHMAQVAEVAVNKSGQIRVERVTCAVDCGRYVNPDTIVAQVQSGIIFGLSAALYEEITFVNGRVEQSNFDTFRVLRIDEAPKIDVHIVKNDEAPGGIGEPGASAIFPAVANAVFAATKVRLRKLPLSEDALKSA